MPDGAHSSMDRELKILIVEDVPADATVMEETLRREQVRFRSQRIETAGEFVEALRHFAPDVVLSDFTLPEFDALEALHLLQDHDRTIPFILVTGTRSEEVAVECIREGAADYILKTSLKRLPSSVRHALQRKAADHQRAQAEAALRRSQEQCRLITEHSSDLISLLDVTGRFLYASPSFQRALGRPPGTLAETRFVTLVHPEDQDAVARALQEARLTQSGRAAECRLQHGDGHWRIFESTANWIFNEQQQPQHAVVIARDLAQRKRAEDVLRGLPRLIQEARETERRRVARELHDSVNQMLASAKFRLEAVADQLADQAASPWREVLKTKALLEKAINEVRRISHNLRPSELDDLGLVPAVRSLCREFEERTGLPVELDLKALPEKWSPTTELDLYRIIQEALTNVEKHARASQVAIQALRRRHWLHLQVRDNGGGFDPATAGFHHRDRPGMGLMDMRERASFIGAEWHVKSAPGAGTEILIRLPLSSLSNTSRHAVEQSQSSPH